MDIKTMWYRLKLLLSDPAKNLWVHPTLGAIFAIFFSLLASVGNYLLPEHYVPHISAETLSSLLDIIASSMLAVTTFSLSIMVSALASTSNTATPRARLLIIEDDYTRIAIASFISAFIYSVIAKIALGLKYYGIEGRFLLFLSTIIVLLYLIYTLIRWVQTISGLGSLNDALSKIENKSRISLSIYATAINVLNALTRLLVDTHAKDKHECSEYDLLSIEELNMEDLIRPIFSPISRDSIANLEIGMRLIKTLAIISRHAPEIQIRQYASKEAADCYHRSKAGLSYAPDRDYLKHEFEQSFKN